MSRFLTTVFLAGLLSTPAWAGPQGRPDGNDTTTTASKVEKPTLGSKTGSKKGAKKGGTDAQVVASEVYDLLHAFGFSSPAIQSLLDGLDLTDLNALLLDLSDGNLAGLQLGSFGDLFDLGGADQGAKSKSKSKAKGKGKAKSHKAEMLAMKAG